MNQSAQRVSITLHIIVMTVEPRTCRSDEGNKKCSHKFGRKTFLKTFTCKTENDLWDTTCEDGRRMELVQNRAQSKTKLLRVLLPDR